MHLRWARALLPSGMPDELFQRIQHLLGQIEAHETRWGQLEVHPAYRGWVRQQPGLHRSVLRARQVFERFRQAVEQNDPRLPHLLDDLEESVHYLSRDMGRLCSALGLAAPAVRLLN